MIVLLLSWLLLACASWRLGTWVLQWCSGEEDVPVSDEVATLFVGLITLAGVALLSVALVPSPWRVLLLPLIACAGPWPPFLRRRPSFSVVSVFVLAALVALGWVSSRDSITYHHDLVHLLSEGGVVRGMGWIHGRFGYVSSWLCLTSWFHLPGLGLGGRMDTAVNGFLLGLCLLDLSRAMTAWLQGTAGKRERFSLVAWTVTLPLPVYLNFVSSPTPDFPVIVYAVVAGRWLLMPESGVGMARDARVALWIGCCAFAIKLSALPIAAVAGVASLWRGRITLPLVRTCLLGAVPVIGWVLICWWMTGYPLYPTGFQWAEVSWQLPKDHAELQQQLVHNFAYWGGPFKPEALAEVHRFSLPWLQHWMRADVVNALGGIIFAAGMCSLPFLVGFRRLRAWTSATACLGLAGSLFLMLMAPAPRFGLGFLLLLPVCLATAWLPDPPRFLPNVLLKYAPLGLILLVVLPTWMKDTRSERQIRKGLDQGVIRVEPQARWLRPGLIAHFHYDDVRDVVIVPDPARSHNAPDSISNTRATWYRLRPMEGGAFVDPDAGWQAGFRRSDLDGI